MEARWWYSGVAGQSGPHTGDQLKRLAASGVLRRDDLVWRDGESERWPAASIKGLFAIESSASLHCRQCGGTMRKTTITSGNLFGILGALVVFSLGLFLAAYFLLTIIGPIVGALMMIYALFMGGKRQKVWKCTNCGYYFVRA